MNKLFRLLILVFALQLMVEQSSAQVRHELSAGISSGFEAGWWIWNMGADEPGVYNNRGWARSHLSLMIPVFVHCNYQLGKLRLGASVGGSWLYDDVLIHSNYDGRIQPRTALTDQEFLRFWRFDGHLGYRFVSGKRYHFTPIITVGTWSAATRFPDMNTLGPRVSIGVLLEQEVRFDRIALILSPKYVYMLTHVNESTYFNEKHKVYAIGMDIGIRVYLLQKVKS